MSDVNNNHLPSRFSVNSGFFMKMKDGRLQECDADAVEDILFPSWMSGGERLSVMEKVISRLVMRLQAWDVFDYRTLDYDSGVVGLEFLDRAVPYVPCSELERAQLAHDAYIADKRYRELYPEIESTTFGCFKATSSGRVCTTLVDYTVNDDFWRSVLRNYASWEAFRSMNPKAYVPDWVRDAFANK